MNARFWAVLGGAAAIACSTPPVLPPAPVVVVPAQGTGTAPLEVAILGTHFDPVLRVTFGSSSQTTIDDAFVAYLKDSSGFRTQLTSMKFDTPERIVGTVPAGLALGLYSLVLVNPQGVETELPDAFRVVTPAENVATFRFDPLVIPDQRVNVPFEIGISAIDSQQRVVDGFTGTVDLRAAGGAVTPVSIGPFTLGKARAQVTLGPPYRGGEALSVDGTGVVVGRTATSNSFSVLPRMAQALGFSSAAQTLPTPQCSGPLVIKAWEANGQPTQLTNDIVVSLSSGSEGLGFFTNASCTNAVNQVTLPAYTASVTVYFKPVTSGTAIVRATTPTLSSAIQDEVVN